MMFKGKMTRGWNHHIRGRVENSSNVLGSIDNNNNEFSTEEDRLSLIWKKHNNGTSKENIFQSNGGKDNNDDIKQTNRFFSSSSRRKRRTKRDIQHQHPLFPVSGEEGRMILSSNEEIELEFHPTSNTSRRGSMNSSSSALFTWNTSIFDYDHNNTNSIYHHDDDYTHMTYEDSETLLDDNGFTSYGGILLQNFQRKSSLTVIEEKNCSETSVNIHSNPISDDVYGQDCYWFDDYYFSSKDYDDGSEDISKPFFVSTSDCDNLDSNNNNNICRNESGSTQMDANNEMNPTEIAATNTQIRRIAGRIKASFVTSLKTGFQLKHKNPSSNCSNNYDVAPSSSNDNNMKKYRKDKTRTPTNGIFSPCSTHRCSMSSTSSKSVRYHDDIRSCLRRSSMKPIAVQDDGDDEMLIQKEQVSKDDTILRKKKKDCKIYDTKFFVSTKDNRKLKLWYGSVHDTTLNKKNQNCRIEDASIGTKTSNTAIFSSKSKQKTTKSFFCQKLSLNQQRSNREEQEGSKLKSKNHNGAKHSSIWIPKTFGGEDSSSSSEKTDFSKKTTTVDFDCNAYDDSAYPETIQLDNESNVYNDSDSYSEESLTNSYIVEDSRRYHQVSLSHSFHSIAQFHIPDDGPSPTSYYQPPSYLCQNTDQISLSLSKSFC